MNNKEIIEKEIDRMLVESGLDMLNIKLIHDKIKKALAFREDNHNWIDEKECFMAGFNKGYNLKLKEIEEELIKSFPYIKEMDGTSNPTIYRGDLIDIIKQIFAKHREVKE